MKHCITVHWSMDAGWWVAECSVLLVTGSVCCLDVREGLLVTGSTSWLLSQYSPPAQSSCTGLRHLFENRPKECQNIWHNTIHLKSERPCRPLFANYYNFPPKVRMSILHSVSTEERTLSTLYLCQNFCLFTTVPNCPVPNYPMPRCLGPICPIIPTSHSISRLFATFFKTFSAFHLYMYPIPPDQ